MSFEAHFGTRFVEARMGPLPKVGPAGTNEREEEKTAPPATKDNTRAKATMPSAKQATESRTLSNLCLIKRRY